MAEVRFRPVTTHQFPNGRPTCKTGVASARNDVKHAYAPVENAWIVREEHWHNEPDVTADAAEHGVLRGRAPGKWLLRAAIADGSQNRLETQQASSVVVKNAADWWTENWHASWSCAAEVRLGVSVTVASGCATPIVGAQQMPCVVGGICW